MCGRARELVTQDFVLELGDHLRFLRVGHVLCHRQQCAILAWEELVEVFCYSINVSKRAAP